MIQDSNPHEEIRNGRQKKPAIYVEVTATDNVNWILKKFKRQCEAYGVVKEYRKRQAHRKPSVKMKEKREAAEKRRHKDDRKGKGRSKI